MRGTLLQHEGGTLGTSSLFLHHTETGVTGVGRVNSREFDGQQDHPLLAVVDALAAAVAWTEARAESDAWELY